MSSESAYTPPTPESQYRTLHPSHLPQERLAEVQAAIAEDGVYTGDALSGVFIKGVIEVVEPERPGGFIKAMPNVVEIPSDHPVKKLYYAAHDQRRLRQRGSPTESISAPVTAPKAEVVPRQDPSEFINKLAGHAVEAMETTHAELADFLQVFADEADNTRIGYGSSADYEYTMYCGVTGMHVRKIEHAGKDGVTTSYALLRGDMQVHRRPAAPDEVYTVVNMKTGDELRFMHSDIGRIRDGDYARTDRNGNPWAINPEEIAKVAGICEAYDADDPILALTRPREGYDGVVLSTTLQNEEQIGRYERLESLGDSAMQNARVTFAPETAADLLKVVTGYRSDWVATHVARIIAPLDRAPIVLDEEHHHALTGLLKGVSKMDEETQRAVFRCIDSIDIRVIKDAWTRGYNIENLVRSSIAIAEDGSYVEKPLIELTKRLICDRYDFTEAIYKAARGMYSESWHYRIGETKGTRHVSERLDEKYARIYAGLFESQLMDTVDIARSALHIPDDIPNTDQIVMLLQQHGYTEKGMRLVNSERVMSSRPDITVPQWAEICMVIDRCRDADISDADRTTISAYNLSPDAIHRHFENGPGLTTEQVATYLVAQRSIY